MVKKTKNLKTKGCYFCGKGFDYNSCGKGFCVNNYNSCGGIVYVLGLIGAVIYYISTATGFWMGVLGILKAIVWPIFVVMKLLGM